MSLIIYTTAAMERAEIDSATSAATGFPKELLIDGNVDTYWKPTSTANQTIDIDLQSAFDIDAVIVWVNNYSTSFVGTIAAQYSDDDSSYTTFGSTSPGDDPVNIIEGTQATHRYWRIVLATFSTVIHIGQIWLCRKRTIGQYFESPYENSYMFNNLVVAGNGGRIFVAPQSRHMQTIQTRLFKIVGSTNLTAMRNAFSDSCGRRFPIIVNDGSNTKLMRFDDNKFVESVVASDYATATLMMASIPYIADGESY